MLNFGQRVKEYRTKAGLTQKDLGAKIGLQKSGVAKYENGRIRRVSVSMAEKFADALGVSVHSLLNSVESNLYALDFDIAHDAEGVVITNPDLEGSPTVRFSPDEWDVIVQMGDLGRVYGAFGLLQDAPAPEPAISSAHQALHEFVDSLSPEEAERLIQIAQLALGR